MKCRKGTAQRHVSEEVVGLVPGGGAYESGEKVSLELLENVKFHHIARTRHRSEE